MREIRVQLRLILPGGRTFGPGKAELLELIAERGSIAAAGRAMRMSYKRAWVLVEEMNQAFRAPLVSAGRGGADGGGAQVTELGHQVLAHYRNLTGGLAQAGASDIDFIAKSLADLASLLPGDGKSVMSE
jgi:molybdate transport system regulatory protein